MRLPLLCAFFVVGISAVLISAPVLAQEYEIRLHRPETVGTKFLVEAEGAMMRQTIVTVAGQPTEQPEEGNGLRLTGEVKILAVTPKGRVSKLSCTVESCVSQGKEEKELIPPGKVIIAEAKEGRTAFSLREGELSPEAAAALELLFSLSEDDARSTDDEIFGTTEKQPVGGSWPISSERSAKDFALEKVTVAPENISGTVTLKSVEQVEGVECLKLVGQMSAKELKLPDDAAEGLPPGVKAESGSIEFRFQMTLPVDPALHAVEESMSARHKFAFAGDAPPLRVETTVHRAATVKRSPVK